MPVTTTYPGVYIEEVPSGVRTITGVATSVTAFVGYTPRGPADEARQVFNFAQFERLYGGLHRDSLLSYAVQHFFQNGGAEAWIVRVASGAVEASVVLENDVDPLTSLHVLSATAVSQGIWGNNLRIDVDYDTSNPASLFNLRVVELEEQNGTWMTKQSETHRNLSMNDRDPNYAVDVINSASELVVVERPDITALESALTRATSTSGPITLEDLDRLASDGPRMLAVSLDGEGPFEIDLFSVPLTLSGDLDTDLATIAGRIMTLVQNLGASDIYNNFSCTRAGETISATYNPDAYAGLADYERSAIRFSNATTADAAAILKLGVNNGGREMHGTADIRPAMTGTVGSSIADLDPTGLGDSAQIDVEIHITETISDGPHTIVLWEDAEERPNTLEALRNTVAQALAGHDIEVLNRATVSLVDGGLRIVAGGNNPNIYLEFSDAGTDPAASRIGLAAGIQNVTRYALGVGRNILAQTSVVGGYDGDPPETTEIIGSRNEKTGFYALEDVDLFNILCLPEVTDPAAMSAATVYAEERRAFLIMDFPDTEHTLDEARQWLADNATLRHKNAAIYFPRLMAPDPLENNRLRMFPTCGAVAGLYSRTDTERGVWKAPAGIDAVLRGVRQLDYVLSDAENGALNPLGINCLRAFPIYGNVCWGARTLVGSDQHASEWKYIPIRRLALYIEESLYRGTQWVVFEPNDEPLWSQIRLNVGAFMHNLFRQGAFQGTKPRDAYFVKCDHETTLQNDIDRGIVNILVGFAPLKPAEFVIIKITQMAGQIIT
jgi:phage tail sheath protein FI